MKKVLLAALVALTVAGQAFAGCNCAKRGPVDRPDRAALN